MAIVLLSDLVVSQIAAGEVVERPASVVKELLENALDANAKHIYIEIEEGGRKLIRVSDDGTGIPADEVPLAVMRHATSKLRQAEDLYAIRTLGFRGEALASIAAVSSLTLVSRHRQEKMGVELHMQGGEVLRQRAVGVPVGTVVSVENLFYNTPARLKFLKAENTERRHIQNLVGDYAMAYPQVRFVLVQDGREVFRSTGSGALEDVVVKVFGLETFRQMLPVYSEDVLRSRGGSVRLRGFVSTPTLHRSDRSRVVLFVNGRVVQDSGLAHAVTQAYHMLLERGRYPYAVLLLDVPPDFVDVNVHPTKAEVRFQDNSAVFAVVQRTLRSALLQTTHETDNAPSLPTSVVPTATQATLGWVLDTSGTARARRRELLHEREEDLAAIPEGVGKPAKPRTLPPLRVVGQVGGTYIVAEGPSGVYLIDQHSAHEAVIYDELNDYLQREQPIPLHEDVGATVEVRAVQARVLEAILPALARFGVVLELFGSATVLVRAVAQCVPLERASDVVTRLLLLLEKHVDVQTAALQAISTTAAVRIGQRLTHDEMQELVRKLERCVTPLQSPSGRPTLLHMSAEQLSQEFKRRS